MYVITVSGRLENSILFLFMKVFKVGIMPDRSARSVRRSEILDGRRQRERVSNRRSTGQMEIPDHLREKDTEMPFHLLRCIMYNNTDLIPNLISRKQFVNI